uniref:hypothetical protein n=1 Tax=Streptomyces buecherae TaxID=2763006 RepID=UPI001C253929
TAGREAIAPGLAGNLLQIHPDFPNMWDAWDVDQVGHVVPVEVVDVDELALAESTDERAVVTVARSFGDAGSTVR